jgi:hypothetical protein
MLNTGGDGNVDMAEANASAAEHQEKELGLAEPS